MKNSLARRNVAIASVPTALRCRSRSSSPVDRCRSCEPHTSTSRSNTRETIHISTMQERPHRSRRLADPTWSCVRLSSWRHLRQYHSSMLRNSRTLQEQFKLYESASNISHQRCSQAAIFIRPHKRLN